MSCGSWEGLGHVRLSYISGQVIYALGKAAAAYGYRAFSTGSKREIYAIYHLPNTEVEELPDWLPLAHLEIGKEIPFRFVPE